MDRIEFTVNGEKHSVGSEVSSTTMLLDYLRGSLELRGTKYMCREGGCGACIVAAKRPSYDKTQAVNSCLTSVTSCHGWEITTIEGIGNRLNGYHPVQRTLAEHNGTQCGYCTPGWVMNMYSFLLEKKGNATMLEIERAFGGNICRCTGYRPILDAFKTFAKDAPKPKDLADIEDLHYLCRKKESCRKSSCEEFDWCFLNAKDVKKYEINKIQLKDNRLWYQVIFINDVFDIWKQIGNESYMLVGGNTAKGVYPIPEYPKHLIDITRISELREHKFSQTLTLGACLPISDAMENFTAVSKETNFEYLANLKEHLDLVAHIPVRNIGTLGGNLMTKHKHNEFPSDLFLLFETVGAIITILSANGIYQEVSPKRFLTVDMQHKIITKIELHPRDKSYKFVSFKIMPRYQNAAARVNAGFSFKLNDATESVEEASLVFGGINPNFVHAERTEAFLIGKKLFRNNTLQEACKILDTELIVEGYPKGQLVSKKRIALGLFYKGLVTLCPADKLEPRFSSAIRNLNKERPVSDGIQAYDSNPSIWPITEPIPKVEALIQCAGEAPYVDDMPAMPGEVFAAFVTTTVANGTIASIDYEGAMKLEGVLGFYTLKDLPGKNSFIAKEYFFNFGDEEVFCTGDVKFYGQPIGVIAAESEALAKKAAKNVKITYKETSKPILTIDETKSHLGRVILIIALPPTDKGLAIQKIIHGSTEIEGQYHFHMETQSVITTPNEDGIDVLSSTQWMDAVQIAVSQALNIKQSCINMSVRRIGGAFGAKISRPGQLAVACALVTTKLNRPCRMILPLTTNMKSIGKRLPSQSNYEVGFNDEGEIQYLNHVVLSDHGYTINEPFSLYGLSSVKNNYNRARWTYFQFNVMTDTAKNTWCRSPGTLESISAIEHIMEQMSYALAKDPFDVRLQNLNPTKEDNETKEFINTIKEKAEYEKRRQEVKEFNSNNRWKKRGLRVAIIKWPLPPVAGYNVTISINHGDGSVIITHGGCEMGQGINTKAIQICAYTLNIPMQKIRVKATNNVTNQNGLLSGGSFTSEAVCFAIIKCCQMILERLAPIKETNDKLNWEELINLAYEKGVNLFSTYYNSSINSQHYYVYASCVSEVEVDILTGEIQIRRVDLLEDVGQSLNPEIDVGQVEGAFVMGLGYWTTEKLEYDPNTGELLTDRTWNYHVPQALDIPLDFRIYFRRNSYNEVGVMGSKATGEPATCLAVSIPFAIREALLSSRLDSGFAPDWFDIKGPYTIDQIVLAASPKLTEFLYTL